MIACLPFSGLECLPAIFFGEISEGKTASAKPINKNLNSVEAGYFSTL